MTIFRYDAARTVVRFYNIQDPERSTPVWLVVIQGCTVGYYIKIAHNVVLLLACYRYYSCLEYRCLSLRL